MRVWLEDSGRRFTRGNYKREATKRRGDARDLEESFVSTDVDERREVWRRTQAARGATQSRVK